MTPNVVASIALYLFGLLVGALLVLGAQGLAGVIS